MVPIDSDLMGARVPRIAGACGCRVARVSPAGCRWSGCPGVAGGMGGGRAGWVDGSAM